MSQALSDRPSDSKKWSSVARICLRAGVAIAAMGAIMFLVIKLTESMI